MKTLSSAKGFTLIELVVVIVILGILAATAAPKFIDLTGDAKESVMQGVQGSLNSAMDLAHAKALVEGQTAASGEITVAGTEISTVHGWPSSAHISSLIDVEDVTGSASGGSIFVFTHDNATGSPCNVIYNVTDVNSSEVRPTISSDGSGC